VGHSDCKLMHFLTECEIKGVRGCELQGGDGVKTHAFKMAAEAVAKFDSGELWQWQMAFGRDIADPTLRLWEDGNKFAMLVLVVHMFDVGFSDQSKTDAFRKVKRELRVGVLFTCQSQGRGSIYRKPHAVMETLNQAGGRNFTHAATFLLPMSGSNEKKVMWMFLDQDNTRVDTTWVQ
jgi:hypothetical protein